MNKIGIYYLHDLNGMNHGERFAACDAHWLEIEIPEGFMLKKIGTGSPDHYRCVKCSAPSPRVGDDR